MPKLKKRIHNPELIDFPENLSAREMERMLSELRQVNRWLGGQTAVLGPLRDAVLQLFHSSDQGPIRIVDIGSGSADIPVAIARWARRQGIAVRVLAVDLSEKTCLVARQLTASFPEITPIQADALNLPLAPKSCHIISFSAFLHHFKSEEVIRVLRVGAEAAKGPIIINDLHRSWFAYSGIRVLTRLFSQSSAIRHDGPLSVRKGFRRHELESLVRAAGLETPGARWRWAFRWVLTAETAPHRIGG